jgi:hypothetical protein
MTQQNLLELAKQGNSKASACLLRPKLKSQGIAVKADIKNDCLIVFLESDEVPDEQASVEFIKKEVEKLGVAFLHVVKVYARQQGESHPTWVKEFEIVAQVEIPLPPGWSLRKANSKDKFKILKLVFFSLYLRNLFIYLGLLSLSLISSFLWLNQLYKGSVNWFSLMWTWPIKIFIIICVSIIILFLCMDISNYWIVECHNQLVGYGILNCLRDEKKSSIQYLFVAPAWRRRGLGSALVRRLIQEATLPLYVDSLPDRVSFYTRLGFVLLPRKSSLSPLVPLVYNIDSGVSSTKRRIN